ncbi:MAG: radical SAM protein [Syntrophales bacterium]
MINIVAPSVIDIETVHGICNASCIMCSIRSSSQRPQIMHQDMFLSILNRLIPYRQYIEYLNIVGLGEAILDPDVFAKIQAAKEARFRQVSLPTNGGILDEQRTSMLLDSGIDIVIFSIDSLIPDKFERIRQGLSFQRVIDNIHRLIELRNSGGYSTTICVRMIEQKLNDDEWQYYTSYWSQYLALSRGDMVLRFPRHNWADAECTIPKSVPCPYVFDRITINASGMIQFCCIDVDASFYKLGSAFDEDPVNIFNGTVFREARRLMKEGRINELEHCSRCDVPLKRLHREKADLHLEESEMFPN